MDVLVALALCSKDTRSGKAPNPHPLSGIRLSGLTSQPRPSPTPGPAVAGRPDSGAPLLNGKNHNTYVLGLTVLSF